MSDTNGHEPQLANAAQSTSISGREPALRKNYEIGRVHPLQTVFRSDYVDVAYDVNTATFVISGAGQIVTISAKFFAGTGISPVNLGERLSDIIERYGNDIMVPDFSRSVESLLRGMIAGNVRHK